MKIHIIGIPEAVKKENERTRELIWWNNDWNFPNLRKNINTKAQETQWTPNKHK